MESKTMNLLTKTTPWVVASLLAAATAFGEEKSVAQSCKPKPKPCEDPCAPKCEKVCEKVVPIRMMPAYNAPARIDVRGCWDIFVSGSFIYWQLSQDNMEVSFNDAQL